MNGDLVLYWRQVTCFRFLHSSAKYFSLRVRIDGLVLGEQADECPLLEAIHEAIREVTNAQNVEVRPEMQACAHAEMQER